MRILRALWRRLAGTPEVEDSLERRELCECGEWLPISDAHLIIDTEDDPESGGGWAQTAAYCPEHCPGGCDHQEDHDHAHT